MNRKLKVTVEPMSPEKGGLESFKAGDILKNLNTEKVYIVGLLPSTKNRSFGITVLFEIETARIFEREDCPGWTFEKINEPLRFTVESVE